MSLLKASGGLAVSAQRLILRLERIAPWDSLRNEDWNVSRKFKEDLEACLYIGAP